MVLALLLAPSLAAAQPTGYQEYYVLGYEEHIWRAFSAIHGGSITDQICSTVSLVATADHQVIYYDHWEDGYETDLFNPIQSTTEVYGDGDPSNGGAGSDVLFAGDDMNQTSDQNDGTINGYVPVNPRNPAQVRYDGGDRIITSGGPVDVTHAVWPLDGSWAGGAWEVYSRQAYASSYSYRLPIGADLYASDPVAFGDFQYVYLQLAAFEDNTNASIDNGAGDVVNLTLDRGQTYSSMGYIDSTSALGVTINAGTIIHTNKPTQVGLITGADGDFQSRFLIVLPDQEWGADYVVPVPRGDNVDDGSGGTRDVPAEVYLSNPNDFDIQVQAYDADVQTFFVISSGATVPYSYHRGGSYVPQDSAARFTSSDGVFGVVVSADTSDVAFDWGFSGIPSTYLTRDYYISWAPGNACTPPDDPTCDGNPDTPEIDPVVNGSPVWVTPLADSTTFYVDFNEDPGGLDGLVDETFTLDVLQQRRIFDPDNDNTGMHVWATGEFAVAWGEDPRTAGYSTPYLDLGLTTLPLQQRWLDPVLMLHQVAQPTTLPPGGGTVTFTLVAQADTKPLVNVDITDTLPISWTYVTGSTQVTYPDGSTANPEPAMTGPRTLFWDLSTDLDLDQSLTLTFQAQTTDAMTVSVNLGQVIGKHQYSDALFNSRDKASVYIGPLSLTKSVGSAQAEIGDTLAYTLSYSNVGSFDLTHVVLRDPIPIQHVTFQSASDGGTFSGQSGTITWDVGALAPGESGTVSFAVQVNSFVENGTTIRNVGYVSNRPPDVPAWASGTFYAVDDLAAYDESVYRCIQAHTAAPGLEPPDAPALWANTGTQLSPPVDEAASNEVRTDALAPRSRSPSWVPPSPIRATW